MLWKSGLFCHFTNKAEAQRIKATSIDIATTLFTLKHFKCWAVIIPLLLKESTVLVSNILRLQPTGKGIHQRASDIADCQKSCWENMDVYFWSVGTFISVQVSLVWTLTLQITVNMWFHTSFFSLTLHHMLCCCFHLLFLLNSLQIVYGLLLPYDLWGTFLIHCALLIRKREYLLNCFIAVGNTEQVKKRFSAPSLPDIEDLTSAHAV